MKEQSKTITSLADVGRCFKCVIDGCNNSGVVTKEDLFIVLKLDKTTAYGAPKISLREGTAREMIALEITDFEYTTPRAVVNTSHSILAEAEWVVNGSRSADYGDAKENFRKVARIASEMSSKEITADDAVNVMIAVKLSREAFKHKRDNLMDLAGYAEIKNRINE